MRPLLRHQHIHAASLVFELFTAVLISFSVESLAARKTAKPLRLTVTSTTSVRGSAYPAGTVRITFTSAFDGAEDWALFLPGDASRNTVVYLHGSFAGAGQIFTRKDVRKLWLDRIRAGR